MSVNEKLKKYQTLFALMGLGSIVTTNKIKGEILRKNVFKRILCWIPSVSFIVINLLQVTVQWTLFEDESYGHIRLVILNAYFCIVAFSNITAHIQCIAYKRAYTDLIHRIANIQYLFEFKCERNKFSKFCQFLSN